MSEYAKETLISKNALKAPLTPAVFLDYLSQNGVKATAFGPQTIRFVTHLDVTAEMVGKAVEVIRSER